MFKFLKKKLKEGISKFSKSVEEEPVEKTPSKKKSLKERLSSKELGKKDFNEFFDELELTLIQANVAAEVIDSLRSDLESELVGESFKRGELEQAVIKALKKSISDLLIEGDVQSLLKTIKESSDPVSILFVGTNGSGKTTSIAKLTKYFQSQGLSVVLAACDTFRAAAIQQLEVHGKALRVKVVKHSYGSDAAAVAFDALEHAKAKGIDVVLIDSAGRSHSNVNLMRELGKIKRVVDPDLTIFVGDSLTGNDVVLQARDFMKESGFDYTILTKVDVDERGGAILSVSHETGKPVLFIGAGQEYSDLKPFKKKELLKNLLS